MSQFNSADAAQAGMALDTLKQAFDKLGSDHHGPLLEIKAHLQDRFMTCRKHGMMVSHFYLQFGPLANDLASKPICTKCAIDFIDSCFEDLT